MAIEDAIDPVEESAVVRKHAGARTQAPGLGPWPNVDVVIHLQVADTQVVHKEVDHLVEVLPGAGRG